MALTKVEPVLLHSFEAFWKRESFFLAKDFRCQAFEIQNNYFVRYFVFKNKNSLTLLGTSEFLKEVNLHPEVYIDRFINQKNNKIKDNFFQLSWIVFFIKQKYINYILRFEKKLLAQLILFVLLPLDALIDYLWGFFRNQNEFDLLYWEGRPQYWLQLVL